MSHPRDWSDSEEEEFDLSDTDATVDEVMNWYSERVNEIWQNAELSFQELGFPDINEQVFGKTSAATMSLSDSAGVLCKDTPSASNVGKSMMVTRNPGLTSSDVDGACCGELTSKTDETSTKALGSHMTKSSLPVDDDNYISSEDEFEYNNSDFEFEDLAEKEKEGEKKGTVANTEESDSH